MPQIELFRAKKVKTDETDCTYFFIRFNGKKVTVMYDLIKKNTVIYKSYDFTEEEQRKIRKYIENIFADEMVS